MESNFSNRDFEQFVKQNADQYRMFPSDKVWKGVNSALHTRRKWYGFWLGFLLLLTGAAVTWVMISAPVSKKQDTATLNNVLPSTPDELKMVSGKETKQAIENLLPFNKQQLIFENPAPVQNDLRVVEPFLLPVQSVTEIQIPVASIQHFDEAETGIESGHFSIINRITTNNNFVNIPSEIIAITNDQKIKVAEESPVIADHVNLAKSKEGIF